MHLFDTSAVIAYLADEPESRKIQSLRSSAALPFIVLTELYDVTWRRQNQAVAEEVIEHVLTWRLPLLLPDQQLSLSAGYLKVKYRLGIADSFIAAFALTNQAILITKDSDFLPLKPDLRLLYLG